MPILTNNYLPILTLPSPISSKIIQTDSKLFRIRPTCGATCITCTRRRNYFEVTTTLTIASHGESRKKLFRILFLQLSNFEGTTKGSSLYAFGIVCHDTKR